MAISKFVRAGIVASVVGVAVAGGYGYSTLPDFDELAYQQNKNCMSPLDSADTYESIKRELEERIARHDTPDSIKAYLTSWGLADQLVTLKPEAYQENAELLILSVHGFRDTACTKQGAVERSKAERQFWDDFVSAVIEWLVIGWAILLSARVVVKWIMRGS